MKRLALLVLLLLWAPLGPVAACASAAPAMAGCPSPAGDDPGSAAADSRLAGLQCANCCAILTEPAAVPARIAWAPPVAQAPAPWCAGRAPSPEPPPPRSFEGR